MKKASSKKQAQRDAMVSKAHETFKRIEEKLKAKHGGDYGKALQDPKWKKAFYAYRTAYDTCPECGSSRCHVENHDAMWGDGDVVCSECDTYVRMFDSG